MYGYHDFGGFLQTYIDDLIWFLISGVMKRGLHSINLDILSGIALMNFANSSGSIVVHVVSE
jgi:hypothetical protein